MPGDKEATPKTFHTELTAVVGNRRIELERKQKELERERVASDENAPGIKGYMALVKNLQKDMRRERLGFLENAILNKQSKGPLQI